MVAFLWILNRRLNGLPLAEWGLALFGLVGASAAAGLASWGVSLGLANFWDTSNFWTFLIQVLVASCFALVVFGLVAIQLKIPEVNILVSRLQKKFIR
jgi:putative peptidoglycan lipid II flippase